MAKSNKEQFIKKSSFIHGIYYDYSKVEYINCDKKVCIICPKHGEFWQTPHSHLQGHGCPICNSKKKNTDKFIDECKKKFGDKYDYSKVEYVNSQTLITIICKDHGPFLMRPNDHLQGQGCPKCKINKIKNKLASTTQQFIEKATKIHGNKYDYSKVEYVNNHTKVCIICPEHGEFWQRPDKHLLGEGCPECNKSKLEKKINMCLINHNIVFNEQQHFNWLGKQSLDFYLPDYNLAIECQGIQHFKPIKKFGGDDGFKATFNNDLKKYNLCKKNGVNLLYYTELPQYFTFFNEMLIKTEKDLIDKIIIPEKEK